MSTSPCTAEVRQHRLHQPAAARSGPRPTRRINAHILNWVRKRERGLSLWDLARPTRHIPSHNAALSTTAQQPWQGAEKKSRRRTDVIPVLLTLTRPPKTLWIIWVSIACICAIFAAVFGWPLNGLWPRSEQKSCFISVDSFVSSTLLVEICTRNLTQSPNTRPFFSRERRQLGALAVPSRHKASHRRWMREEWFSSIGHRASVCALHTSARSIIISAPASPRITDKVNNTNNHSLQLQPYGRHT